MFEIMLMAENIKKYRKKRGLKQNEFAEMLNISPQSVSKWECGQACPTIENLCEIAEILNVPMDVLVNGEKDKKCVMIGVDGGGSKTEFILFEEDGKILDRIVLAGCNPNTVGFKNAADILEMGIDTFLKIEPAVCGVFIGAAGLDSGDNTRQITELLKKKYPQLSVRCENDIFNVIACGENSDDCIAVICGTGVAVYARKNEEIRRFGGRGYLLDGGGSGYHIGRDALCAVLDVEDGLEKQGILADMIWEKLGGSVWGKIQQIYGENQAYTASLAPVVFEAYEKGDMLARQILEKNAEYLAELINLAGKSCGVEKNVTASGSILTRNAIFAEMLKEKLDNGLELTVPEYPPVFGACMMCCRLCGIDDRGVRERFMLFYDACRQ